MGDVTAIILAAGLSRRMGNRNKLLLPVGGIPMIRRVVDVYTSATTGPVLVVTGHEAEDVAAALAGSPAVTVFNPEYGKGQATSVACGLRAVKGAGAVLIGLGDQPLLTSQDVRSLVAAHASADEQRISIPAMNQRRGNPVLIPAGLRGRLLENPRSPGCRTFTRANPDHVQFHALMARGFYADMDTPDAYDALIAGTLEAPA